MTQAKAQVEDVRYVPAALALHQRPGVPGVRSTFGTSTELLNSLRLMFSRLANHLCPNGHYLAPSMNVAAEKELVYPECAHFCCPGAEDLAFNAGGAYSGTGLVRTVDESTLVPDETKSIDEGAVLPWQTLMWSLMKDIAREMHAHRCAVQPADAEGAWISFSMAPRRKAISSTRIRPSARRVKWIYTYFNAIYTVENALSRVKDEKG